MTAHIFITLMTLTLLTISFGRILRKKPPYFPWLILCAILFAVLPISFHGMSVIAHFVFAATSDNLLWHHVLYPSLFLPSGYLLFRIKSRIERKRWVGFLILWLFFGVWYVFVLTQSMYEPGRRTPEFTDTPILFAYWSTLQLFIITIFWMLTTYNIKAKKKLPIIGTALLALIYLLMLLSTFG